MSTNENISSPVPEPIKSSEAMENALRDAETQEQLYSIALFDILGFSNFVQHNETDRVLKLYNTLVELIHRMESNPTGQSAFSGSVVPVPVSPDCKSNQLVANSNGYIQVCHFSDTFLIYTNFLFKKQGFWLRDSYYEPHPLLLEEIGTKFYPIFQQEHPLYLSFLQICMEFFCESIKAGIPLRGCISTGMATMNKNQSIFFGRPLVEAAKGEPAQNSIGVAFGKSFNNYHPIYNRYFIPYLRHIKEQDGRADFLSPMLLDWPRFWRDHYNSESKSIKDCIDKMNTDPLFSSYYDKAIEFANFSEQYKDWSDEIDYDGILDILNYYERIKAWYRNTLRS